MLEIAFVFVIVFVSWRAGYHTGRIQAERVHRARMQFIQGEITKLRKTALDSIEQVRNVSQEAMLEFRNTVIAKVRELNDGSIQESDLQKLEKIKW